MTHGSSNYTLLEYAAGQEDRSFDNSKRVLAPEEIDYYKILRFLGRLFGTFSLSRIAK